MIMINIIIMLLIFFASSKHVI